MKQLLRVGAAVCALGALFAACSSGPTTGTNGTKGNGAGSDSTHGMTGSGGASSGSSGSNTGGDTIMFPASGSGAGSGTGAGNTGSGGGPTCAGETTQAQLIPLDIYLMLDSSGSMTDTTGANGTGPSKWDAVTQALSAFFADPQSAGLGVGLQHFPLLAAGVPASCTMDAQCPGQTGPCLLNVCKGLTTVQPCTSNADCFAQGSNQCVTLGQCGGEYCAPANGATCVANGMPCNAVTTSYCANQDSCQTSDYAAPSVEITSLNGSSAQLDSAIMGWTPTGSTPTAPALGGAIQHAKAWASNNPTHTVVVVLATDGLPTECTPQSISSIAQIAAQGAQGAPAVKTFAIGVFAPSDITAGAQSNLDQIAASGGTTQSFIVDTSQNVTQQFLDALNSIRGTKLACDYAIPPAGDAGALDFGKVNVEYTPPGASMPTTVGYAGQAANCDPTTGGWYYDVDPTMGGTPTKITMCPATCSTFTAVTGGQVEIRVGCKTVIQPPPK